VYDVTKAQRLLGYTATTSLAAGTAAAMSWYRRHGFLQATTAS
jgi:nucleoside-diphosphate-sugar epimerase